MIFTIPRRVCYCMCVHKKTPLLLLRQLPDHLRHNSKGVFYVQSYKLFGTTRLARGFHITKNARFRIGHFFQTAVSSTTGKKPKTSIFFIFTEKSFPRAFSGCETFSKIARNLKFPSAKLPERQSIPYPSGSNK